MKTLTTEQARVRASGKYIGIFPFEFDDGGGGTGSVTIPRTIHLIPIGTWDHDLYGPIIITPADIRQFASNFNAGIRKGIFITAGHEGYAELPAQGWITSVEARDDGLWGVVDWNQLGVETLSDKQYKFFSPEFFLEYADPETHEVTKNVLTGGALTKSPYFKELEAVVFSDRNITKKINTNENIMDIAEILKLDKATLTDEQKAFIKTNADKLTDEQKVEYKDVVGEADAPAETDEEKTAREEKEKGDANEAAGLNRDGSAKTAIDASEKVQISAGELAALTKAANEGKSAFAELRTSKITASVKSLVFNSKTNSVGRFLPKSEAALQSFMEKLDDGQRAAFATLVAELPSSQIFAEKGDAGTMTGSAESEVEAKTTKLMTEKKMSYSDALKQTFAEDAALHERYVAETGTRN